MVFASALQIWHFRLMFQSLSSILYSLPPGSRFISPAQTLYLLYILTLPILFPSDRVQRRLSFFSFPRGWKGDELAVLWSRLAVELFCLVFYI
jgi:hypothetical protein